MNRTTTASLPAALVFLLVPFSFVREDKTASIAFERSPWKKGETITAHSEAQRNLQIDMMVKGELLQRFTQSGTERCDKKSLVQKGGEDGPAKLLVSYADVFETTLGTSDEGSPGDPPPEEKDVSPLNGKSFVLERGGDEISIKTEADGRVERSLAALVREREVADDGSLNPGERRLAELVAGKSIAMGQKLTVPEEIARELLGNQDGVKRVRMSMKLSESRTVDGVRCGLFKADLDIRGEDKDAGLEFHIQMDGEVLVTIGSGRFLSADLDGSITVEGSVRSEEVAVEMTGAGKIHILDTAEYAREE